MVTQKKTEMKQDLSDIKKKEEEDIDYQTSIVIQSLYFC